MKGIYSLKKGPKLTKKSSGNYVAVTTILDAKITTY